MFLDMLTDVLARAIRARATGRPDPSAPFARSCRSPPAGLPPSPTYGKPPSATGPRCKSSTWIARP